MEGGKCSGSLRTGQPQLSWCDWVSLDARSMEHVVLFDKTTRHERRLSDSSSNIFHEQLLLARKTLVETVSYLSSPSPEIEIYIVADVVYALIRLSCCPPGRQLGGVKDERLGPLFSRPKALKRQICVVIGCIVVDTRFKNFE